MKSLKHYGLVVAAGVIMAVGGIACKKQPKPVGKIVGAPVVSWTREGIQKRPGAAQISILNLEGSELVLYNRNMFSDEVDLSIPLYEQGDTVWFYYNDVTAEYGEIFADQVVDTAIKGKSGMDFLRKQQREIYGK